VRIAYVITRSDSIGGAHIHVRDVATAMMAAGHQVTVLVGHSGPFTEELEQHQIPFTSLRYLVRPISPHLDIAALVELLGHLRELQPDLVSAHSSKAGWLARVAGQMLGIPVIFTAHGWAFADGVPLFRRKIYLTAEKIAGTLPARIITVSDYDRRLAIGHGVVGPEKVVTIHNGMPDIGQELSATPGTDPPRIVMVARFAEQKDHQTLVRALGELRDLDWSLDLVGDGPLRPTISSLVQEIGLDRRIRLLGFRRDVAQVLASAQVFVLASKWEGFPRTILEAMRAGLPVVASDVGGVSEAVADKKTGFLVTPNDEQALTGALRRLIGEPDTRKRMGESGRKRYESEFTFDGMLDRTAEVYETVIGRSQ